jgi:phage terminase large subunit
MKTGQYETTTAFETICNLRKEVRIVQGGKSSSKTISILMLFILLAISKREGLILSVVAESMPNLLSGALRYFEKILKSWGLYDKFKINNTRHVYTYGSNLIEFFSVDGENSRLGSRRSHLYINEADSIKFSTFIEIYGRTSDFTIMDYNPRRKFWAHKELIGEAHVDFLTLNFTHNEFIPAKEKASILWFKKKADEGSRYFKNKWRVLGLGLLGITEGVIFEKWTEANQVPPDAHYLGAALDWGFTNDPTAIVKLYRYNQKIYIKESLYKRAMLNSQIAKHIIDDPELLNGIIIADAAEPKSIAELKTYGVKIKKSDVKDIDFGISVIQEFELVVVGKNAVEEFENYCYKRNKAGEQLDIPIDDWNHIIDPTRYFFAEMLAKSSMSGNTFRFVK